MKRPTLTRILAATAVAAPALALAAPAAADDFPSMPVTFVVPFSPGGSNDIMARELGKLLSEKWGQPVVVENRPGAGATVGSAHVAKQPADGYTIMIASITFTMRPAVVSRMPYDATRDFTPVAMIGRTPLVLGARPDLPAKTPEEFFAWMKANQGKVNYAATGKGSIGHFAGEMLNEAMGFDANAIQYKGGAPAMTDVMGGHVDYFIGSVPQMLPNIEAGKMIAIAVTSKDRSEAAPDVPSFAEAGVPDYDLYQWWGILAPAGLPADVLAKLNADINAALDSEEMRDFMTKSGATPTPLSPAEFDQLMADNFARWEKVAKARHISAE